MERRAPRWTFVHHPASGNFSCNATSARTSYERLRHARGFAQVVKVLNIIKLEACAHSTSAHSLGSQVFFGTLSVAVASRSIDLKQSCPPIAAYRILVQSLRVTTWTTSTSGTTISPLLTTIAPIPTTKIIFQTFQTLGSAMVVGRVV